MLDRMHARRIGVTAARLIGDEGIVLPAIPQLRHDFDEFLRARVAIFDRERHVVAEVRGGGGVVGRHRVERDAPAAQMIDRCEAPREIERIVERGRCRADQPDMLRRARKRGQKHGWLQRLRRPFRMIAQREQIGEKHGVELAAFGDRCDLLEEIEIDDRARIVERAPSGGMTADAGNVRIQMQLARVAHDAVLSFSAFRCSWLRRAVAVPKSSTSIDAIASRSTCATSCNSHARYAFICSATRSAGA